MDYFHSNEVNSKNKLRFAMLVMLLWVVSACKPKLIASDKKTSEEEREKY